MDWKTILISAFAVYAELAKGGAKTEADQILSILGGILATPPAAPPAA